MLRKILISALLMAGLPWSSELSRKPYLQAMTSHSVAVAWRTATPVKGAVLLRAEQEDASESKVEEEAATTAHVVKLEHLLPQRKYRYKILSDGNSLSPWIHFRTFSEVSKDFRFEALGDSGTASQFQNDVAFQMAKYPVDFVIHTGDVIYGGKSPADFDKKFFSIYASMLDHIPFFLCLGNHDADFHGGSPYLENFYLPRYYSFKEGEGHFIALDSNDLLQPGSSQYQWLNQDLKNSKEPLKVVYFHHPIYSTGYHGSTRELQKILIPLFEKYRVTLVLNGHDHDYERTVPIHGITYLVTGGGGAPLYPPVEADWTAHSESMYNFVLFHVVKDKIHLVGINSQGEIFDRADLRVNK